MTKPDPSDAPAKPRRFWTAATVGEPREGRHPVLLDGRTARTPGGSQLATPGRALAERLAAEWEAQGPFLDPATMPLTRLAATAIDRTPLVRDALVDEVVRFAASDLICYLAEGPETLVERELAAWRPWLDWAAGLGVALVQTRGIVHVPQPAASISRLKELLHEQDDWRLTATASAAALFGSAVLALAASMGRLSAADAFELSRIDERFQAELWGEDPEARTRSEALRAEARVLDGWYAALGAG